MTKRNGEDEQTFYVCGQCLDKQWYLKSDSAPVPCPDCGWWHKDILKYDLPSDFKIDLSQY
jgi:DNA-directed RNA polymerase subunit RPC12/RpoP